MNSSDNIPEGESEVKDLNRETGGFNASGVDTQEYNEPEYNAPEYDAPEYNEPGHYEPEYNEPTVPVNIIIDYPEDTFASREDYETENTDALEALMSGFSAPHDSPQGAPQDSPRRRRSGSDPLPKAARLFPFGVKERPVRKKIDIKGAILGFFRRWAVIVNLGPVLVLALLVYSMVYVIAEKPYIMLLNGEKIAIVQEVDDGKKILEQLNKEMSSPYPAEANFRQYAVLDFTREGVQIKTKPTDAQVIKEILRSKITWFIDAWTISVSNERTVYLATKSIAEAVLDDVKKSYLPDSDDLTILNAEFVEKVELIKEEIPITSLGSPEQAFRTLVEGRDPVREYIVQRGDTYSTIAKRNNMSYEELMLINGAKNDRLSVGQVLVLNTPKPLLSVKTTVS